MSFTITKISANNFSHFDGFKTMNFSNWEIVFNYTSNTIILQMLNGAPFPKMEVSAFDVIIKNGIAGTPETFSTVAEIRARLVELNYNPLQSSAVGSAEWGSITGDIESQEDLTDFVIPRGGTIMGKEVTGNIELANEVKITNNNASVSFEDDIAILRNEVNNNTFTASSSGIVSTFDDGVNNVQFSVVDSGITVSDSNGKGIQGLEDFSPNITDLDYTQKAYVDTKIPLTGTESGAPITGDLILEDAVSIKPITGGGGYYLGDLEQGAIQVLPDGQLILKASDNTSFKGLEGDVDFTPNLTDLAYPQKIYVDTKIAYENFEVVSANLKSNPYVLNYTSGKLTSIVYTVIGGNITKTLNYTGEKLTSIVLSGNTPNGISLTKTLSYTGDSLTNITYS